MKKLSFLLTLLVLASWSFTSHALTVDHLRVEARENPEGIEATEPAFSWQLHSDEYGVLQTSYQLVVATDEACNEVVWNSGSVSSDQSVFVRPAGIPLQPSTRYYWRVTVSDNKGHTATSQETAFFVTGLMDSGWSGAQWIKPSSLPVDQVGADDEEVKDYTVEAKFEIENVAAGIVFAAKDAANCYMWQFNTEGDFPRFRPHRWNGGSAACLADIDLRGKVDLRNGREYSVRIVVTQDGRHATTYLDDVLIDERDGDFYYGKVGMRADYGQYGNRDPEVAYYDDFLVTDQSGNVRFSEDFSASNKFDGGEIRDGRLYVVGSRTSTVWVFPIDAQQQLTHFAIDYDMLLVKASAAIVFAATSANTYHMWQINCLDNANPAVRHHIYINGNLTWNDSQFTQFRKEDLLGSVHHYRVEVDGTAIKTYVDGILVDTYTDTSATAVVGDVGFRVSSSTGEEAYFDNVKVTVYDAEGLPTITLSEDFEQQSSDYFYDIDIVDVNGNRMCHVYTATGDLRIMQAATTGTAPLFRKQISLAKPVRQATLYTTALGVYDLYMNGQRVGHVAPDGTTLYEELKPGWTDYRSRVFYSTHDVTPLLVAGDNVIGALVASGWWAGAVMHGIYGSPDLGFMAKLLVTYDDGTTDTFVTDRTWASSLRGALRSGEIYDGEVYDARLQDQWTMPGYDQSGWNGVAINTDFKGQVVAFTGGYVTKLTDHLLAPKKVTVYEGSVASGSDFGMVNVVSETEGWSAFTLKKGQTAIIDFGQNMVGWVEFTVKGKSGNRMRLRYTEMLNDTGDKSRGNDGPGGSLYLTNLRTAKAQLYYTLNGNAEGERYHPNTTFFGFRYCEITAGDDVEILALEGQPISSSSVDVGSVATSHADVNKLFSNIFWGQRGNLLSVPTDCPQRDERLGWTADTQIFSRTGMYNGDTYAFYRKWMTDMRDSQRGDGAYADVAPFNWVGYGNAAWSDAGIVVPWNIYLMYGDKEVLRENFASMESYMKWLATQTGDGYKYQGAGTAYGDWLSFVTTDNRYVSVAYYAYDAQLMAKMAHALSEQAGDIYDTKAHEYEALFEAIKEEFRSRYISPTIRQTSQTAYLLALKFNLLADDDEINTIVTRLNRSLRTTQDKLNTGFVGTGIINPTLSQFGLTDRAYNLLLQRQCPSWLYSIDQGATTVWERWNSYTVESGFGDPSMNSFNHYAYGAVGEWMYRYMAGIEADEEVPGFRHIILQPSPDFRATLPAGQEKITHVEGRYTSAYGEIASTWSAAGEGLIEYDCQVPANATATLYLPVDSEERVIYVNGKLPSTDEAVEALGYENGCQVYRLGSGHYVFSANDVVAVGDFPQQLTTENQSPVYDIAGRKLLSDSKDLSTLGKGVYITGGRKIVKK